MSFVLDCSIALTWCFEDEATSATDAQLDRMRDHGATVPAIWHLEIGNILAVAERRGRISAAEISAYLALIDGLPIRTDRSQPERGRSAILDLARREGLTTYDAAYLDLAMRGGMPLATKDTQLRTAAGRAGVNLLAV